MGTLNQNLSRLKAMKEASRPAELNDALNGATEDLKKSDILDGVKKVGDRAPLFARPNTNNDTIRLRSLLRKGPVVLSFFRGRW